MNPALLLPCGFILFKAIIVCVPTASFHWLTRRLVLHCRTGFCVLCCCSLESQAGWSAASRADPGEGSSQCGEEADSIGVCNSFPSVFSASCAPSCRLLPAFLLWALIINVCVHLWFVTITWCFSCLGFLCRRYLKISGGLTWLKKVKKQHMCCFSSGT